MCTKYVCINLYMWAYMQYFLPRLTLKIAWQEVLISVIALLYIEVERHKL